MKYVKKPIVVEAIQFTGRNDKEIEKLEMYKELTLNKI